jgi:hypothetical protein
MPAPAPSACHDLARKTRRQAFTILLRTVPGPTRSKETIIIVIIYITLYHRIRELLAVIASNHLPSRMLRRERDDPPLVEQEPFFKQQRPWTRGHHSSTGRTVGRDANSTSCTLFNLLYRKIEVSYIGD